MPSNVKNANMFVVTVLREMRPNPHRTSIVTTCEQLEIEDLDSNSITRG